MNRKYTPGPWTVDINTNAPRESETIRGADNVRIAAAYSIHEHRADKTAAWYEARANAKLMAAAPDLLAALQVAEAALDAYSGGESSDLALVRAAIEKATR